MQLGADVRFVNADDEPYAIVVPALRPVPPKAPGRSRVPLVAAIYASPAVWAVAMVAWALPQTTYPHHRGLTRIFAQLTALAGLGELCILVPVAVLLLRRVPLGRTAALGVSVLQLIIGITALTAAGSADGFFLLIWLHVSAAAALTIALLLTARVRSEFRGRSLRDDATPPELWLTSNPASAPGQPLVALRLLVQGLTTLQRVLFVIAALFAMAAGQATHVTGSLIRRSQQTEASLAFMLIALCFGVAATLVGRKRQR